MWSARRTTPPSPARPTTLATTPLSREKPYLFLDEHGDLNVRVPGRTDTSGTTWANGETPGRTRCRSATSSSPSRRTRSRRSTASSRGRTCSSRPASTTSPGPSRSSGPARWSSGSARRSCGERRDPAGGRRRARRGRGGRDGRRRPRRVAGPVAGGSPCVPGLGSAENPTTLSDVYFRVGGRTSAGPHRARGQQRPRADRSHLGLAGRPRGRGPHRHRAVDHQHRPQRRGRQRRPRDRERPVRRALPAVQHRVERRRRQHDPVPERAALRPADAGRLDERRGRGGGPATRSATG